MNLCRQLALPAALFAWLAFIAPALSAEIVADEPAETTETAEVLDEIILKDGSRILGTITAVRDDVVTMETGFAGTLSIDALEIESLTSEQSVVLLFEDNSLISERPVSIAGGEIVVEEPREVFPIESLAVLNPEPWELGEGYNWSGLLSFALVMERGNTDTDELDYKIESTWLSTRDRYRLNAVGENDESNGIKTADSWKVVGKYDYFLTDPNYWGVQVYAEKDKFADLDLRAMAGPYYGRQIFDQPILTLSTEIGASYVDENFNVAEDQDYGAATWFIDLGSNYLGGDSKVYVQQFGLWNLDDTSDVVVNTTAGLSFPLLFDFEAALEALWEYDSGAVENVDDLDETYRVRIGYTW